jgi:hypothetical protein
VTDNKQESAEKAREWVKLCRSDSGLARNLQNLIGANCYEAEDQLVRLLTAYAKFATQQPDASKLAEKVFKWDAAPEMCDVCDSREFISHGLEDVTCYRCLLLRENSAALLRCQELEQALREARSLSQQQPKCQCQDGRGPKLCGYCKSKGERNG